MWVMMHAEQSYLNRDYSILEQKGRCMPLYHILSWFTICLVLSWCLILACLCWVLTQTTLVENTRLNAKYSTMSTGFNCLNVIFPVNVTVYCNSCALLFQKYFVHQLWRCFKSLLFQVIWRNSQLDALCHWSTFAALPLVSPFEQSVHFKLDVRLSHGQLSIGHVGCLLVALKLMLHAFLFLDPGNSRRLFI